MQYYNTDKQRQTLQGVIAGLMGELAELAPHPDAPKNKGPVFLFSNPNLQTPSEYDGMLGSLLIQSMLGAAFTHAVSGLEHAHGVQGGDISPALISNAINAYSEYMKDRPRFTPDTGEGKGTFALMSGKRKAANDFNGAAQESPAMEAFRRDLPRRLKIESALADACRKLEWLTSPAMAPALAA